MADNYVQIRIKATDTAKPDLTALKADLDELGAKVEEAKATVDTREGRIELADLNARLAALNKRVTSPRIDVAGAAKAEADLAKVDERFDKLKESADKAKDHAVEDLDSVREHASKLHEMVSSLAGKGGLLGKLLFGAAGEAGGGSGALGGLKDVLPFGGSPVALAGIAGAIAAALTEIDALASGFAAAGAGAGAFAILALPAFDKVKGALKDTHAQLMKLDPDERGAVEGIKGLEASLGRMSKAFEPAAFKVFNDGLKIANELLPHVAPFANIFASGLDKLLKQADRFAGSKGFTDWLKQFKGLEGGSLRAIGEGLGHVVTNFGKLFTIMSKKDVVNGINIAFSILDGTLIATRMLIRGTMVAFDAFNSATRVAGHAVDVLVHVIASGFDTIRANITRWAADVGRDTERVVAYFRSLPGRVMSALSALPGELFSFGMHIIDMLADGIRSAAAGPLGAAMNFVGGLISDFIPHSPAKKGPLSGSGDPRLGGKRIAQMLADGMTDGASVVSHAADRMAGAASVGGHGGGGGGRPIQLEVRVPRTAMILGNDFWTAFQNGIRAKGGDPRIVQMKVVFQ